MEVSGHTVSYMTDMGGRHIGPPWTCGQLNTAGIPQEQCNRYRTNTNHMENELK